MSQARLAHRLGVTATSVARWERNERPISELTGRFVRVLAEIESKASPDLAARVARLLPALTTRHATTRARTRKRTS
ncbi:MAG: helix-turn-helix transcriptional regulator [Deltaproteobacteria bacterium]|nr:helix-turn-helix transcriptional regulator [Deltaproteobacteria bacterium]